LVKKKVLLNLFKIECYNCFIQFYYLIVDLHQKNRIMAIQHAYQVNLNWKEGRKGLLQSPDLNTSIEVVTPPEFTKGIAGIWSPEHLFIASVNSCFMTTFLAVAEYSKFEFKNLAISANGILEKVDEKFKISEITLKVDLTIEDISDKEKALKLIEKSEKACLITNSVKTIIKLESEVFI